ncbi:hypothetical protein [Mucilaginibacter lappiensis]|uniref:Uncharacterized protein n=1 Tax=Mucilaginibacter lappiensis TaxID=354630 RepID=A0A841JFE7_9SPHI|nr:hypothetical protein [Mucilaginibacter lappiensis]MBB6129580.1 hypothetical protein [Mucilaginibacter lappiensis]
MDNLKRPDHIPVEIFINKFIQYVGGELVSEILSKGQTEPNADYLFEKANVIIELKCFEKDIFGTEDDIARLFELFRKWINKGYIKEEDQIKYTLGSKSLPEICRKELWEKASKTIDRAVHHANKQIESTKILLNYPEAMGLVFLVNDGNYFLNHEQMFATICNLMLRKYTQSAIDGFVYFTVNQVANIPGSNLDWNIWVPAYREENNEVLGEFVNFLGGKLDEFITQETGIPSSDSIKINEVNEGLDLIRNMSYIPKKEIFKKK